MAEISSNPQLYSSRDEWKDITPVPQSDLSNPLIPIFYPPEYTDALDYFRGIIATGERSERVLQLTEHIVRMNPAHYSVWQYRYDTLVALGSPLDKELLLMDELALDNMKYYQVWHHRRLLMTQLKKPLPELIYIAQVLSVDSKNYHTWAYRQWLLTHFDQNELWKHELPFVELLLTTDIRNNSAWHHRFFVAFETGVREGEEDRNILLRRELGFVKQKISLAPNNLSAWNYFRGALDKTGAPYASQKDFVTPYAQNRQEKEESVYDLENPAPSSTAELPCALAIEFLADIAVEEADTIRAVELFHSLASTHDTMRKKYWDYRARQVQPTQETTSSST